MRARLLFALLMSAAPLGAQVTPQVAITRGWPLDRDGMVKIFNPSGSIRVIGWDRDSVAVSGSIIKGASFYGGGSRRGVKLGLEGMGPTVGGDLVVRLPAGAVVSVRGAATDITVEGLTGMVDAGCVTGLLRVLGDPRELLAEAMDGTVDILGSPRFLRAKTASGALRWLGASEEASLGSVSGSIEATQGPVGRIRIETISGDVTLDASLRPDADVVIESHSGSIDLRVAGGVPARLSVDAARVVGGPAGSASKGSPGKRPAPTTLELNGATAGASAAAITVRSFKGELRILPSRGSAPK